MTETEEPSPEFTVLGKRNEIPVTVENMQQAYENIRKNKTAKQWPGDNSGEMRLNTGDYQITTTHYYVKFTPQDSTQYFTITNDSILSVSDVPFEYEIEVNGSKYQDPDLVGTDFTYYYSVVPVDYNIPENVPYEILANLHFTKEDDIPDDAPEEELQQVDFFHDLNMEAQKISNNLENIEKEDLLYIFVNSTGEEEVLTWQEAQNRGLNLNDLIINFQDYDYGETDYFERRRRWRPSGIITVKEDIIKQNVGVAGAKVKVRKWGWVVIRNAYTNDSGYFITSSTRTKRVKYSVHFHNSSKGFKIKAGHIFWNARHIGQHTILENHGIKILIIPVLEVIFMR